jgi:hypothetical protein
MKKKVKRFQGGGLSGIADTATSLIGKVNEAANSINYGSPTVTGSSNVGFNAVTPAANNPATNTPTTPATATPAATPPTSQPRPSADPAPVAPTYTSSGGMSGRFGKSVAGMKKGGTVKSTASKRGDGCAVRGKTRGRMV